MQIIPTNLGRLNEFLQFPAPALIFAIDFLSATLQSSLVFADRKCLIMLCGNMPIQSSIESYLFLMSVVAIAILVTVWVIARKKRSFRRRFLSLYDINDLRSNPYKVGLIYRVVETNNNSARVVPIWSYGKPVLNGSEYEFDPKNLAPFDHDRFIAGR